jgi:hypothetical protein
LMFDFGTKITVLASSVGNSRTGPKYGSEGYVIGTGTANYTDDTRITNALLLSTADVLFTRYGFGKARSSAERKEVLNVLPIMRKPPQHEKGMTVLERLERTIKRFNKEDFGSEFWYNIKSSYCAKPSSAYVAIMVPAKVYGEDLITCPNIEFKAWFESMILAYDMSGAVTRATNKIFKTKFPKQKLLSRLIACKECTKEHEVRRDYAQYFADTHKRRKEVVETLRIVMSMAFPRGQANIRRHLQHGIDKGFYIDKGRGGGIRPELFFSTMADNLFSSEFEWKKERIMKASIKNKKIILDRLSQTKDAMSFLSSAAAQKTHHK